MLLAATVPGQFRHFHLPWVKRLRELGCVVHGADRITEMPECVAAFNGFTMYPFPAIRLTFSRQRRAHHRCIDGSNTIRPRARSHAGAASITRKYAHISAGEGQTVYTAHGFHFHDNGSPLTNFIYQTLEKRAGKWTDYLVVINHDDEAARDLKIVPPEGVFISPASELIWNNSRPRACLPPPSGCPG
jgi:hypothetical protein